MTSVLVTDDMSHDDTSPLKLVAQPNMEAVLVTDDMFHDDTSPLKLEAS